MDASVELSISAAVTIAPLVGQTLSLIVLYGCNSKSVSESKAVHPDGAQRMKAAVRRQLWFGAISTPMTTTTFVTVTLQITLPAYWLAVWAMWMVLGHC
ncbi:hypothetical protein CDV31_015682, partial [Fusarium ambrosium]